MGSSSDAQVSFLIWRLYYVTAKRTLDVVRKRFEQFGVSLVERRNVVPENDSTTFFVCSGMQDFKSLFLRPDGSKLGTVQTCVRTNDIELIGDGSHLSSFRMLGNFSFGGNDYQQSVEMWHLILNDLSVPVSHITVHPSQQNHKKLWRQLGYNIRLDEECVWSDGNIGGFCCEVFVGDLEVGNLVNTLGHSTDVGFGLERLQQVVEGKSRVDETSLFDTTLHPVVRDHNKTLDLLFDNGVKPGNKGPNYICRKLLRRLIPYLSGKENFVFGEWLLDEQQRRERCIKQCKNKINTRKYKDKTDLWWWDTLGILPHELMELKLTNSK